MRCLLVLTSGLGLTVTWLMLLLARRPAQKFKEHAQCRANVTLSPKPEVKTYKNIVFAPNGSFCYAFRCRANVTLSPKTSGKNKSLKSIRSAGRRARTLQKPCFWTGVGLEVTLARFL